MYMGVWEYCFQTDLKKKTVNPSFNEKVYLWKPRVGENKTSSDTYSHHKKRDYSNRPFSQPTQNHREEEKPIQTCKNVLREISQMVDI